MADPTICPTCRGAGVVPKGSYLPVAVLTATDTNPDSCRTCEGSGLVERIEAPGERIRLLPVQLAEEPWLN